MREEFSHLPDEGLYDLDANDFFGLSPIPEKVICL
jgi:hypothetical protein